MKHITTSSPYLTTSSQRWRLSLKSALSVVTLIAMQLTAWVPKPALANWSAASTLYGSMIRRGYEGIYCSVTVTNWSSSTTTITITPDGKTARAKSVAGYGSAIWNASEFADVTTSEAVYIKVESNPSAAMTGVIQCNKPAAAGAASTEELIPDIDTTDAIIPFVEGTWQGGYIAAIYRSGNAFMYRPNGALLGSYYNTHEYRGPANTPAFVVVGADLGGLLSASGVISTASGVRGALAAVPVSSAGRSVAFPRACATSCVTRIALHNTGNTTATVMLYAYDSTTTAASAFGPISIPAYQSYNTTTAILSPGFDLMSLYAEALEPTARLVGALATYNGGATWNDATMASLDYTSAPSGPRVFGRDARITFHTDITYTTGPGFVFGTAIIAMNTSLMTSTVHMVIRNSSGAIVSHRTADLGPNRRTAFPLNDITYPAGEYSAQAYPDITGTVAVLAVASVPGYGSWATTASVQSWDTTSPTVAHGCGTGWNPSCAPTATDSGAGVVSSAFYAAGASRGAANQTYNNVCSLYNLTDGLQTARVTATDRAGNTADTTDVAGAIRCDRSAPNAPALSRNYTWNATSITWTNPGDVGPSGVSSYFCSQNNGTWTACASGQNPSSTAHNQAFRVYARDNAGNPSGSPTNIGSITIRRDTQAPPVPSPSLSATWNPTQTSWAAVVDTAAAGEGAAGTAGYQCRFNSNDATITACASPLDVSGQPNGTTLQVRSRDAVDNPGSGNASNWSNAIIIQRDSSGPVVSVNCGTGWNPNCAPSATDAETGISQTRFEAPSGVSRGAFNAHGSTTFANVCQWLADGNPSAQNVLAWAQNGSALTNTATTAPKCDRTAPASFNLLQPANGSVIVVERPQLTWQRAGDTTSGVVSYMLYLDGAPVGAIANPVAGAEVAAQLPVSLTTRAQPYEWNVSAWDYAGNSRFASNGPFSFTYRPYAFIAGHVFLDDSPLNFQRDSSEGDLSGGTQVTVTLSRTADGAILSQASTSGYFAFTTPISDSLITSYTLSAGTPNSFIHTTPPTFTFSAIKGAIYDNADFGYYTRTGDLSIIIASRELYDGLNTTGLPGMGVTVTYPDNSQRALDFVGFGNFAALTVTAATTGSYGFNEFISSGNAGLTYCAGETGARAAQINMVDESIILDTFRRCTTGQTALSLYDFVDLPPAGFGYNDIGLDGVTITVRNDAGAVIAISQTVNGSLFIELPSGGTYTVTDGGLPGVTHLCAGQSGLCAVDHQPNVWTVVVSIPTGETRSVLFGDTLQSAPTLQGSKEYELPRADGLLFVGDTITYTLRVTNTGSLPVFDVVLTDTLPANTALLDWSAPGATTVDATPPDLTAAWPVILAGSTRTATLVARILDGARGGGITNTFAFSPISGTQPGPVVIPGPVLWPATLSASKSVSRVSLHYHEPLLWTITLTNSGDVTATATRVTDTFPAGYAQSSATPGYTPIAGGVRWSVDVPPLGTTVLTSSGSITPVLGVSHSLITLNSGEFYLDDNQAGAFASPIITVSPWRVYLPIVLFTP
jgi:uncharacterized repeat protein (TIGR01451 family)